jgi:hypothetical protein
MLLLAQRLSPDAANENCLCSAAKATSGVWVVAGRLSKIAWFTLIAGGVL